MNGRLPAGNGRGGEKTGHDGNSLHANDCPRQPDPRRTLRAALCVTYNSLIDYHATLAADPNAASATACWELRAAMLREWLREMGLPGTLVDGEGGAP